METNNKLFKTVLLTVGTLVISSFVFINYIKLDEPVFFEHYYDLRSYNEGEYYEEMTFNLRYITNIDDNKTVIGVRLPEYPEVVVQASEHDYMGNFNWGDEPNNEPGENYGRYSLRTVYCNIIELQDAYDDTIITKALIQFDDNSEMLLNIGQLHLYKSEPPTELLESNYGSSSSDGISESRYRILGDLTFESSESPFLTQFSEQIALNMNDLDISKTAGVSIEKGEYINIKSQLKSTGNIIKDYRVFDIHPKLVFSEENGNQHSIRIFNINNLYNNDYSFINLYRYISERGGI